MSAPLLLSPAIARRLAVIAQQLEAPPPNPTKADLLQTIARITCLQLDPINVVARSQLLVPFSRLGPYDPAHLEALLWEDRALFEYWAHAASIVLADDFAIFRPQMHEREVASGVWRQRVREWQAANHTFQQAILDELARRGPLFAEQIESRAAVPWPYANSWGSGSDVGIMLEILWLRGYVTITGRQGNGYGLKKQWGLMEHQVGDRVHAPPADRHALVRRAAERALLALGPARLRDVRRYFTRHNYPGLAQVLAELLAEGVILPLVIGDDSGDWPGPWYLHRDLLPELERARRGDWQPQTVLLSPFDNLIADRDRTELLFNFFYRSEIYTPAARRVYGYYVMPILHGERIIGRVDPRMDRQVGRLVVNAVHLEPGVSAEGQMQAGVEQAIEALGSFLRAKEIEYTIP